MRDLICELCDCPELYNAGKNMEGLNVLICDDCDHHNLFTDAEMQSAWEKLMARRKYMQQLADAGLNDTDAQ